MSKQNFNRSFVKYTKYLTVLLLFCAAYSAPARDLAVTITTSFVHWL